VRATPRTRIIRLDLGAGPFPFAAGQAAVIGRPGSPLRKPYSIASSPRQAADAHTLEFLVQIDDADEDAPHLEEMSIGTPLAVDGPFGTFTLPVDLDTRDVLLVAGGTGIAPLRSMLWDLLERQADIRLALVYSARSADEFAYESELRDRAAERRVDVRFTVTREGKEQWLGPRGRIDARLIQSVVHTTETRCAICGPPGMVNSVTKLLVAAGISPERILTESFST